MLLTFTKQLTIIGTGYWLSENDSTQAYNEPSMVGRLNFNNGSQGSVIEGVWIDYHYSTTATAITINTNNITIRRNHINAHSDSHYSYYATGIIYRSCL